MSNDADERISFEPLVRAYLPKITDEIAEDLRGTSLIKCDTYGGLSWTQEAVDFVCVLNNARAFAAGKKGSDPSFSGRLEQRVICQRSEKMNNKRLKDQKCPQCGQSFLLVWNDYTTINGEAAKQTLILRGCPSGGIYDVSIHCPHCDYEEDL